MSNLTEQEIKAISRAFTPLTHCFKHGFKRLPCGLCAAEQQEKDQGICPECHGEGEQGGQFCGGYWECESCKGTGVYSANRN